MQVLTSHSEDVTCVVLTGRGRFAVTGSLDGTAQVWDMQAQDVCNTQLHDGKVRAVFALTRSSDALVMHGNRCQKSYKNDWDL